jgi:hypothetical protein
MPFTGTQAKAFSLGNYSSNTKQFFKAKDMNKMKSGLKFFYLVFHTL